MEEPKHSSCGHHDTALREHVRVLGGKGQGGDYIVEIDYATLDHGARPHLRARAEAHQFHSQRPEKAVIDRCKTASPSPDSA
jgi:hypothetical protein